MGLYIYIYIYILNAFLTFSRYWGPPKFADNRNSDVIVYIRNYNEEKQKRVVESFIRVNPR